MKYVLTALATLLVLAVLALAFPFSGLYDVGATAGDSAFTRWYLGTLSERSIRARAGEVSAPGDLADSARVARGAVAFSQMCQRCHGAPGRERSVVGKGLTPRPPRLAETADAWKEAELYWIVENGIKMTGMPAFGPTHDEAELWELVAFVRQLPGMTAERYAALTTLPDASRANPGPRADDGHDHVH